jgi:membrane protease YdiL (CAAX protease family)
VEPTDRHELGSRPHVEPRAKSAIVGEVARVYAAVCAVSVGLGLLEDVAGMRDVAHLGFAALFLWVPLRMARREGPSGARRLGIDLGGMLEPTDADDPRSPGPLGLLDLGRALQAALPSAVRELGVAIAIAAIVFPPFVVGFWLWNAPSHPFEWRLPGDLASFALTQLVLVGLPEEALFRGYVQTRLHDAWPPSRTILGARVHLGPLVAQAALFALVHLATEPHVAKLAVFFPGLLFGWLRAWRGGIGAAIWFHALSNVLAEILVTGWLR